MWKKLQKSLRLHMGRIASVMGSPLSFSMAGVVVLGWAITGPLYNYSDAWMLWINTLTTILTFLLGFSIQFTQNRDTKEIKAKLNALMRQNDELSDQLDLIEKELQDEEE